MKKAMKAVLQHTAALALATITTSAQAGFNTGNDMAGFCGSSEGDPAHYGKSAECRGYIIGVVDSITRVAAYDEALCLPDGVTVGQLTKVVEKFMSDYPADLHRPGAEVVAFAMFNAFPCE